MKQNGGCKIMIFKKNTLFIALCYCSIAITCAQDTTFTKSSKIGGFITTGIGWDHTKIKYMPLGNVRPLSYGLSYEREITKKISFETGLLHSIFIGNWIIDSVDTDLSNNPGLVGKNLTNMEVFEYHEKEILHHIRIPLIVNYHFRKNEKSSIALLGGVCPGIFIDKWSRTDQSIHGIAKYLNHYKRYGGIDIITMLAGIEFSRNINETIALKAQFRASVQIETITTGFLIGINHTLK